MFAVPGVYDGKSIRALEPISAPPNARVIITFLDEEVRLPLFAPTRLDDVAGCLPYHGPARTLEQMDEAIRRGAEERKR